MDMRAFVFLSAAMLCFGVISCVLGIVMIVGFWKMLVKANQPGWYALVPFYNVYILVVRVLGLPVQWCYYALILYLVSLPQQLSALEMIPVAINIPELSLIVTIALSILGFFVIRLLLRSYGQKDTVGATILMLFFPYILAYRLGFGPATYLGQPTLHDVPRLPWFR